MGATADNDYNKVHNKGLVANADGDSSECDLNELDGSAQGLVPRIRTMGRSLFNRATLEKRIPIIQWAPRYTMDQLQGDVLAGFTVGLTVIPQGIAYAIVAGAQPNYGLYSAFVGCFVYMIFGSVKDITIGPTAIMSIMTHTYTGDLACYYDDMAVLLAFLSGCVILVATFFRIGFLITFIGRPVISGFTSAAALTIATGQIKGLFGISFHAETFVETWVQTFKHITDTRYQDAGLGLSSVALLLVLRSISNLRAAKPQDGDPLTARIWKKAIFLISVGRNAIVVIIGCVLAYCLREHQPFSVTGEIEAGFPLVSLPKFTLHCNSTNSTDGSDDVYNFGQVLSMFGSGLAVVPLIAILENIAIASAFSHGKAIDATQEMLALGLCNLAGSFFQSLPTTGSFSRTAVNSTSGVRTPAGGFTTGVLVILALLFLTPAFKYIPKSTLAAVIICAVIFSVEFHDIIPIWKTYRWDQIPLWVTFFVCLLWALEWGILIGAGVNICMLLYLQATPTVTVALRESSCGMQRVVVVQPALGLLFPNSERIKMCLSKAGVQHLPLLVVLDCAHVTVVDYTAALGIRGLCKEFSERKQRVAFANMSPRVRDSLMALTPSLEEVDLPALMSSSELPLTLNGDTKELMVPVTVDVLQINGGDNINSSSPQPLIGRSSTPAAAVPVAETPTEEVLQRAPLVPLASHEEFSEIPGTASPGADANAKQEDGPGAEEPLIGTDDSVPTVGVVPPESPEKDQEEEEPLLEGGTCETSVGVVPPESPEEDQEEEEPLLWDNASETKGVIVPKQSSEN